MNKAVNSVPGVITKPVTKLKESLFSSDHDEGRMPVHDGAELMTLEGTLYYKKGGRGRPFKWKRRFRAFGYGRWWKYLLFQSER